VEAVPQKAKDLIHHFWPGGLTVMLPKDLSIGLLSFKPMNDISQFSAVEVLSPSGDLREAARNLFSALRRLDAADIDLIVAQRLPEQGLGITINDRLTRACY
jgi:L-threonylcarbamoyladenylate synthase